MDSLQWALSRLVLVAVGLAPMLVYWAVGVIGRATRRKRGGPRSDSAPIPDRGGRSGSAGARRLRQGEKPDGSLLPY